MTQPTYTTGAVKQDPETKAIALRTTSPEDGPGAWGVMTVANGGCHVETSYVEEWADLELPVVGPTP
jgi:hypothetical protein